MSGLQGGRTATEIASGQLTSIVNTVDEDYFETMGVAIVKGREFTSVDQESSTPGGDRQRKDGARLLAGRTRVRKARSAAGETAMRQIVGIARTANYTNWAEPPQAVRVCAFDAELFGRDGFVCAQQGGIHNRS